ncbi:MAG: serpin family protein, partial [Syntrophales bacterium]|nr:serpin family protein [Syntrophales bacterium]
MLLPALGKEEGSPERGVEQVVAGNNEFALSLYERLRGSEGNLFFSPYSLSSALAMVYGGARGKTEKEMAEVLHFGPNHESFHASFSTLIKEIAGEKRYVELRTANALWGQNNYEFYENYLGMVEKLYGAGLFKVDFKADAEGARRKINTWVGEKTNEKITNLIEPGSLGGNTKLVLTNAVYFKGKWDLSFDPSETLNLFFYASPEKTINTKMMTLKAIYPYAQTDACQMVELPYKGRDFSMCILLPLDKYGISEFEKSLSPKMLTQELVSHEVKIYIPKFTMKELFSLEEELKTMGMQRAFSYKSADFSGMSDGIGLMLSAV